MSQRAGRLIKKAQVESDGHIEITKYPWDNFAGDAVFLADNARNSILFKEHHDPKLYAEKVRPAPDFTKPLQGKSNSLFPVDLTADYAISQEEIAIRRKRSLMDEDEAVAMELADMVFTEEEKSAKTQWSKIYSDINDKKLKGQSTQQPVSEEHVDVTATRIADLSIKNAQAAEQSNSVSQEKINHDLSSSKDSFQEMSYEGTTAAQPEAISAEELEEIRNKAWEESYQAGYAQGYTAGVETGDSEGRADGESQGREAGYNQGFLEGEEKGTAVTDSKMDKTLGKLGELFTEVDKLKNEILTSGQEVFVELAKMCIEKILRVQVEHNDAALRRIFDEAVQAYSENESLILEMNPHDANRLKKSLKENHSSPSRTIKVVQNSGLDSGDFKIEAGSEVVIVELGRAVDSLVRSLQDEIFSADDTSSSAKKVG